jgi:hypothetical protein
MKNNRVYFLLTIFCLVICIHYSCKDEGCGDLNGDLEYFVFGHFYGECAGEGCVEMFKVENGKLYEDDIDDYPNYTSPIEAHWNELPAQKYDEVKNLSAAVPWNCSMKRTMFSAFLMAVIGAASMLNSNIQVSRLPNQDFGYWIKMNPI